MFITDTLLFVSVVKGYFLLMEVLFVVFFTVCMTIFYWSSIND